MNDSDSSGAMEARSSSQDEKDRKIASSSLSATATATATAAEVYETANNNDSSVMIGNGFHRVVGLKPPAAVQSISAAAAATMEEDDNREEEKQPSSPTRGRQLHRKNHQDDNNNIIRSPSAENGFVPLKVIHVPNKITTTTTTASSSSSNNNNSRIDATKRAPSVPDLSSLHHPPLSDIILKTKQRYDGLQDDQREQLLEERLRRAHLRLLSDNNNNVQQQQQQQQQQRYRSKSTPSRGGWGRRRYDSNEHHGDDDDEQQLEGQCREEQQEQQEQQIGDNVHVTNEPPTIALTQGNNTVLHNTTTAAAITLASVKSLDVSVAPGSHNSHHHHHSLDDNEFHDDMVEPPPPPPPPPITERERLVERERQARMEMERARHRQKMALQRERQLEDESGGDDDENMNDHGGGHSFDNDGSDDDHQRDDDGIPSPPIPPPPATEKERLVERERQARLETERARRRHLAFQREEQEQQDQQLEIEEQNVRDENNDSHGNGYLGAALENNYLRDIDDTILDNPPDTFVSPIAASRGNSERSREVSTESVVSSDTGHGSGGGTKAMVQNTEAEAANNLSYPMERFLGTLGDETANAPSDDMPPLVENDESSLPYTMELFLAENAAAGVSGDNPPVGETAMGHLSDSNILTSSTALDLPQPPSSALSTGGMTDPFVNENIATSNFVDELAGLATGSHVHSDELDGGPLRDNDSALLSEQHSHSSSTSRRLLNLSVDSLVNNNSAESPELTSRPSRPITEADIAQLAEVEHASIGNAAPMSERDEPSEASIPRRPLLDQAFSVATQTTIIDSVTETSVGHSHQVSEANQSMVGSSTIIRVGGSVETDTSDGASSASIEAVPSIVSAEDEENSHLMINPPSTTRSESQSQSVADDSNLSPEINLRMPELMEADVVAMAEIDYASIGNAPPHSVRDERLSESSLTDRGGRQFSVATPISEMDSIDENSILRSVPFRSIIDEDSESSVISLPQQNDRIPLSNESENTSVEVMPSERSDNSASHNSIEVMLSEHDDDSIDGRSSIADNDDMLTSASIEVSPSVDLENNIAVDEIRDRLDMYGATSEADTADETYGTLALESRLRQYDQDEESAPLISPRLNSSNADSSNHHEQDKSSRSLDVIGRNFCFVAAEIPHFILVTRGSTLLCPFVGAKRYQIILAAIIILTSAVANFRNETKADDRPLYHADVIEISSAGFCIGLVALMMSGFDIGFASGLAFAATAATIIARLFHYFVQTTLKLHGSRGEVALIACGDFVRSVMLLSILSVIFNHHVVSFNIEEDDVC